MLKNNYQNGQKIELDEFLNDLEILTGYSGPPDSEALNGVLDLVNQTYHHENPEIRPYDCQARPGGILDLTRFDEVMILPDLHGRRKFLFDVLHFKPDGNHTILDKLENENFCLLCLGDGIHTEGDHISRWSHALTEFLNDFKVHKYMDQEIADSFNLMMMVHLLKIRYPDRFHFLKGNHENILNETGNGNYAFAKYANEGMMFLVYFRKFYGEELLLKYAEFEKNLPLFVKGRNFLASHAEPLFYFDYERILNSRYDGEIIEALTWTDNYTSSPGTIDQLISHYIQDHSHQVYYFGGHRPIKDKYFTINGDRYVQIHNPKKQIAVLINQSEAVDLEKSVLVIPSSDKHSVKIKQINTAES